MPRRTIWRAASKSQSLLQKTLADLGFSHSSGGAGGMRLCAAHNNVSGRRPPPLDRRSALFIDVDGTLLEIAPRPEQVQVPGHLPRLLAHLAELHAGALALVSGRLLADI